MKHFILFVITLLMVARPVSAQLDTLYFDDFVDNRHQWEEYSTETSSLAIRDGFLDISVLKPKGRTFYHYFKKELPSLDTFVYEVRIVPEELRMGGALYGLNHRKASGKKPPKLCCYYSMAAHKKGVFGFFYSDVTARVTPNWVRRIPEMNREEMVFRVAFGSGKYHYYYNGAKILSYKPLPLAKGHSMDKWGWLTKGRAKYRVDYILLLGKKS